MPQALMQPVVSLFDGGYCFKQGSKKKKKEISKIYFPKGALVECLAGFDILLCALLNGHYIAIEKDF